MKLIRYNTPLTHSPNELASWFRDPLGSFEPFSDFLGHRFRDLVAGDSRLAVDLYEDDNHYFAQFHLPGVQKDDLKVRLDSDSALQIGFERKISDDNSNETIARASRRLQFPEEARVEETAAKFENGILTLTIPKLEPKEPRTIEIA